MAGSYPLPIQEGLRDLLADLLGRGVAVDKAPSKLELEEDAAGMVGDYVTDDGRLAGLCIIDGAFACRAGAALVMVPAVVANESVGKNELPENLVENTYEIVNIMARLLNSESTPHLKLRATAPLPGDLPEEITTLRSAPASRRDFVATIEGYGEGRVTLLVA